MTKLCLVLSGALGCCVALPSRAKAVDKGARQTQGAGIHARIWPRLPPPRWGLSLSRYFLLQGSGVLQRFYVSHPASPVPQGRESGQDKQQMGWGLGETPSFGEGKPTP